MLEFLPKDKEEALAFYHRPLNLIFMYISIFTCSSEKGHRNMVAVEGNILPPGFSLCVCMYVCVCMRMCMCMKFILKISNDFQRKEKMT